MKQLYIIGILVAVVLLLILGLSKLTQRSESVNDTNNEVNIETSAEDLQEITLTTDNKEAMDTQPTAGNTTVVMKTNKGDITIELFTKDMPITAGNFLKLAQDDYYDGIKFHRVINNFMIQGGDPLTKDDSMQARWGTGGPGYAIDDEHVPGFSNVRGTLSMANSGPGTGGSQFFINTVDNVNLDFDKQPLQSKHPVFARVVAGMEVVDDISKVETAPGDRPLEPVVIEDIIVQQ